MNTKRIVPLLAAMVVAPAALAQSLPSAASGPIGELQAQLGELTQRVQTLESNAPSSNVEGRTYCFVLDLAIMRGLAFNQTEEMSTTVVRRTGTFSGGVFTADPVSNFRAMQTDDGVVSLIDKFSPNPVVATYTQSGNKLDMTIPNPVNPNLPPQIANWYVSGDGSLISGSALSFLGPFPNSLSLSLMRTWTLVENDTCDAEGI